MAVDLNNLADVFAKNLPSKAKQIGLAVSGGSDSVALLRLAARLSKKNSELTFTVFCVDHQLRAESANDARFVMALAEQHEMSCHILVWEGDKPQTGIQEAARNVRYSLMVEKCAELGVDVLITAHTADDQAETFLMRLKRGSGLDGLSAMSLMSHYDGFPIVRPLLGVTRQTLRSFLTELGQDWIDDPSNNNTEFERVRVRRDMPRLAEMGLGTQVITQSAARLVRARQAIESAVNDKMPECVTWYDNGCCEFKNASFNMLDEEISLRILSRMLLSVGGGAREPQLQKLERLLEEWRTLEVGSSLTLAGCRLVRRKEMTIIVRETRGKQEGIHSAVMAILPGQKTVWDRRFICEVTPHSGQSLSFDWDKELYISALGEKAWQSLKDQRGAGMPSYMAQGLVSLWRGDELLSVPHIGLFHEKINFDAQFTPRGMVTRTELHPYS